MPKKLTLPEMACQLGTKFEHTGKGEGDERKSLAKFTLEGLLLPQKQLDKLLGEGAHERLFTRGKDAIEPAFGADINELKLAHRYLESTVTLELDGKALTLPDAKITGVILQPQNGGMTWMSCDIEAPAERAKDVEKIGRFCGMNIRAQLAFGQKPELDKRQKQLALDEGIDDDKDFDEIPPAKAKKVNGSRPNA